MRTPRTDHFVETATSVLSNETFSLVEKRQVSIPVELPPDSARVVRSYDADLWVYQTDLSRAPNPTGAWRYGIGDDPEKFYMTEVEGDFSEAVVEGEHLRNVYSEDENFWATRGGIAETKEYRGSLFKFAKIDRLSTFRQWLLRQRTARLANATCSGSDPVHMEWRPGRVSFDEVWVRCPDGWALWIDKHDPSKESPRYRFMFFRAWAL